MRGLFRLYGARIWSVILIIVGVILLIIAFFLRPNTAILSGLGIASIILGITTIILCNDIALMMQSYDEELYRRIKHPPPNTDSE